MYSLRLYSFYSWSPNKKGQLLFHQKFSPVTTSPCGVVIMCHGFGDHSAGFQSTLSVNLARLGFVVLALDYAGHGRSDGLHALISSVDEIAVDVLDFAFASLDKSPELKDKAVFIYGESLGGAVAFKSCTADSRGRDAISGCILMAPMIKISDKFKPAPIVVRVFKMIRSLFPHAPIGGYIHIFHILW
jgi:acylglycerol lipase